MGREIKSLKNLEREVSASFHKKEGGIYLVDTGALIDMQRESERQKRCFLHSSEGIEDYLRKLEIYGVPLVTDLTYEEIDRHSRVKINRNRREISPCVYGWAGIYNQNYRDIEEKLSQGERDLLSYDAWLMLRNHLIPLVEGTDENRGDCVSDVDGDIIRQAYRFCKTPYRDTKQPPERVCIITSDGDHVAKMAEIIKELGCDNLDVIQTRS